MATALQLTVPSEQRSLHPSPDRGGRPVDQSCQSLHVRQRRER
jgi:hypothetical protein